MIQSFELWCDYCLKTKYYDDLKAVKDESFIKINNSMDCTNYDKEVDIDVHSKMVKPKI